MFSNFVMQDESEVTHFLYQTQKRSTNISSQDLCRDTQMISKNENFRNEIVDRLLTTSFQCNYLGNTIFFTHAICYEGDDETSNL